MPRGRPKIIFTELQIRQAEIMAGLGLTREQMSLVLGVSERTLRRRKADIEALAEAIATGQALAAMQVARTIFDLATKEKNLAAAIWYEKTRCGRSDRIDIAHQVERVVKDELSKTLDYLEEVLDPEIYSIVTEALMAEDNPDGAKAPSLKDAIDIVELSS